MNYKHGGRHSALYPTWCNIKARCHNPNHPRYRHYGGRGIFMCEEWKASFDTFRRDMGERPPGMSVDRIDNNAGYSPENCRWATQKVQCRNKRDNRILTAHGISAPMAEWAERSGISTGTIWMRLESGWSEHDAVSIPLVKRRAGNHPSTKYHGQDTGEITQEATA